MTKIKPTEYSFAQTLKPADIKKDVMVKIKRIEDVPTKYGDKRVLVFDLDKAENQVFLNGISIRNLVEKFGDDTTEWIGEKVTLTVINSELTQNKDAVVVIC